MSVKFPKTLKLQFTEKNSSKQKYQLRVSKMESISKKNLNLNFVWKDVFGRLAGVHALKDEAGTPFTIGDVFNVIGKPTGCLKKFKCFLK